MADTNDEGTGEPAESDRIRERRTAPMSPASGWSIRFGTVVLLVGLLITFGIPIALTL